MYENSNEENQNDSRLPWNLRRLVDKVDKRINGGMIGIDVQSQWTDNAYICPWETRRLKSLHVVLHHFFASSSSLPAESWLDERLLFFASPMPLVTSAAGDLDFFAAEPVFRAGDLERERALRRAADERSRSRDRLRVRRRSRSREGDLFWRRVRELDLHVNHIKIRVQLFTNELYKNAFG